MAREPENGSRKPDLTLPSRILRRLTWWSIVTVMVLGGTLLWTALQIARSVDAEALAEEEQRVERAIAVAGGGDGLSHEQLLTLAGLTGIDAPRLLAPGDTPMADETSLVVGPDLVLAWTPNKLGTSLFSKFAPVRMPLVVLLAGGLLGVILYLNRLAKSLEGQRRAAATLAAADSLTGLANRLGFETVLATRFEPYCLPTTLLYLDLDGFKAINDRFGHLAGDRLLASVGLRLQRIFGDSLVIARLGGDEFAVLLADTDMQTAEHRARETIAGLRAPHDVGNRRLEIGVSIGIAQAPRHARSASTLVSLADAALYRAKANRSGFCHAGSTAPSAIEAAE